MIEVDENTNEWLHFFFENADFGPAHEDVVHMLYASFKESGGQPVEWMEEMFGDD